MKLVRAYWHLLAGIILGLALGLVISWGVAPRAYTATSPATLRSDFKATYRAQIASAHNVTGDLERAQTRLASLADNDDVEALTVQAQRELAQGNIKSSEALAALAKALQNQNAPSQTETLSAPTETQNETDVTPTVTLIISESVKTATPTLTILEATEAPINTPTNVPNPTATPAATSTPIPTIGAPYVLINQDEICSETITEGLLMVFVTDARQNPIPGVEVIVEWSGKEEHFFTGLKPELGKGYADFNMQPNQRYALRLATGSTAVSDLSVPPCQDTDGNHYWGSLRLRFQQP